MIIIQNCDKKMTEKIKSFLKDNDVYYDESNNAWSYICEEEVNAFIDNMECDTVTADVLVDYQEDVIKHASEALCRCEYTSEQFMINVSDYVEAAINKYKKQADNV